MEIRSDKLQSPSIEGLNINQYKIQEFFCAYDRKNDLERRLKYLSLGLKLYLACGLSHDQFIEFHKERRLRIKRNLNFLRILMLVSGLYFMYESKFWIGNSFHNVMKLYFTAGLVAWFIPFAVKVYTNNIRNSLIHTTTALTNDRCRNWLLVAPLNDQSTFRNIKDRILEKNFENYEVKAESAEDATMNAMADNENTKSETSSESHEATAHDEPADVTANIDSNEMRDNSKGSETRVSKKVKEGLSDFDNSDNFAQTDNSVVIIDNERPETDKADEDQVSLHSNVQSIVVATAVESQVSNEGGSLEPGIDGQVDNSSLVNEVEKAVTQGKNIKGNNTDNESPETYKADENQVSLHSHEQSIVITAAVESQMSNEGGSLEPGIDRQIDNSSLVNEVEKAVTEKDVKGDNTDIESTETDKADEDQVSLHSNEESIIVDAAVESQVSNDGGSLESGIDGQVDISSLVNEVEKDVIEKKNIKENKFRSELREISRQENQFNNLPMIEVINFFYIMCCPTLQEKVPQMSEEDFISFLKMAFLGAPKCRTLRFKHYKNKKKYIRGVFYQFLLKSQNDAYENVIRVRERYAALIYEHFEGFSKQNVLDNFSKDESSWLSHIRNNNKSSIPIIQELPN